MRSDRRGLLWRKGGVLVVAGALIVLVVTLTVLSGGATRVSLPSAGLGPASPQVTITQFSFQPMTVNSGSQVTGTVGLSGGTPPYYLWFNNTPPGCSPSNSPISTSSMTYTFQCNPSSSGSYSVHLDVVDSSVPPSKATEQGGLDVNSGSNGNGNGSNNGGGGNNSLGSLIPSGFLTIGIILVVALMGAIIAIAAGVVALAVLVPRRLRQLNETLAKSGLPPKDPKPPA